MIELVTATPEQEAEWRTRWLDRQHFMYAARGLADADVAESLRRLADWRAQATESMVSVAVSGGEAVGFGSVSLHGEGQPTAVVDDIWVAPKQRRCGHGATIRSALEQHCRERQVRRLDVTISPTDPAQDGLFRSYAVTSQRMALTLTDAPELPDGVRARPMIEAEFEDWQREQIEGYAEAIAASGVLTPEEAHARSVRQFGELLPQGLGTDDHSLWVLESGDESVATLWIQHHVSLGWSFVYGVEVDPSQRGKGYGRTIMRLGERICLEAGDHVLALNVFGYNSVAIGLYTSLGYTVTDQSRGREITPPG